MSKKEKRRLSQIMMEYDLDNNGEFSKEEVIRIVRDMDFIKLHVHKDEEIQVFCHCVGCCSRLAYVCHVWRCLPWQ